MKRFKKMKKSMSMMLMLALIFSMFGGIASGPASLAVYYDEIGTIGCKIVNFDARSNSYDEINKTNLYQGYPVTVCVKRKTGCRIPKGSYIIVLKANDYRALRADGVWIPDQKDYIKYSSKGCALNYYETSWCWSNGWALGKYVVCLVMPYTEDDGSSAYTFYAWNASVVRYG